MTAVSAPIEILLVEQNPADVRLTLEALKDAKVRNHLHVATDGVEAMALLRGTGERRIPLPDLILLDINLPKTDGREVLDDIRQDARLRDIPVVILTTSLAKMDIMRSYHLRANAFITKPVDGDQFFKVIKRIEQFWLEVVTLSRP